MSAIQNLIINLRQQNQKQHVSIDDVTAKAEQAENERLVQKQKELIIMKRQEEYGSSSSSSNALMIKIPKLLVRPKPDTVSGQCNLALNRAARSVEAQQLLRCVVQWEHVCHPLWKALANEAQAENQLRTTALSFSSNPTSFVIKSSLTSSKSKQPVKPDLIKDLSEREIHLLATEANYLQQLMGQNDLNMQLSFKGFQKIMGEIDGMRNEALKRLDPSDRLEVAEETTYDELEMQREHQQQQNEEGGGNNNNNVMSDDEIKDQVQQATAALRAVYRTSFPSYDDAADDQERTILDFYSEILPRVDAALFLSCPRQAKTGTVDVRILYELLQVQIAVTKFAAEMLLMDETGERVVPVEQLEAYIEETLPGIPGFQNILRRQLVDVIKTVQVERFTWQQLDKRSPGRLDLRLMLASQDLKDMLLHQLKPEELSHHPVEGIRWFACGTALRLYDEFNRLDQRRTRLLSLGDFRKYRRVLMTNAEAAQGGHPAQHSSLPPDTNPLSFSFIRRYFETVPNFNNEMDFRCFVQFVLMVESLPEKCPRPGVFFDIFDADGVGVLTPTRMSRFMLETRTKLAQEFDSYGAYADRQVDDLFHLIKTRVPYEIRRKEFIESVNSGLFCALAIDCVALLTYEQRDWTNPKLKQEELMQRPFSGRR